MATVNKDFKIKSGLIVEGTTATVNGHNILTESTSGDQYILNLTGGATLVKSVSSEFDVSQGGELSLDRAVVDAYYDAAGSADNAETAANTYTDNRETAITTAYQNYADQAETDAVSTANAYTDTAEGREQTNRNNAIANAISDLNLPNTYDAKGAAATAEQNAKNYADMKINDASNATNESWSAYKTSTEIGLAQAAAETHADEAIAALVGAAPLVLDTLEELATALENNPDIIADLENVAAGKQNTLTPGANIDISNDTISVTGLDSADISDFNTAALSATSAAYDAAGSASAAQTAAQTYADGLAVNYDVAGAAATAEANAIAHADALTTDDVAEGINNQYFTNQRGLDAAAQLLTQAATTNITISGTGNGLTITAENGVADSTTSDLTEGSNLYFTDSRALDAISGSNIQPESLDITWVRREEATWTGVATASTATVHSFGTNKGSVKYLVRVISGGNSHVTELLATTDQNNNVAVVEYGTIYTSENPLASVTVVWDGQSAYNLNVTTANNNSEVLVAATLLSYND
jgi:hypothetical protein